MLSGKCAPSKRLARAVALVGKKAQTACATPAMTWDTGLGCNGLLGQLFAPQLFHAGTDRLEVVSCSGL
jgi:hypothetical protein